MWKLINGPAEWDEHRHETCRSLNIVGTLVDWGKGPQTYPCLVASLQTGQMRIATAYVYQSDAELLLKALPEEGACAPSEAFAPQQAVQARSVGNDQWGQQQQFNVNMTAQILTLSHFLIETGIAKPEQYEQTLAKFVAQVDQWHTEDIENEVRKRQRGDAG